MNSNSSGTGLPVHVIVPVPRNGGSDIAPLLHSSLCRRACALVAALTLSVAFAASAQDYPSRPIRLIVASSPGSGVDIVARLVAQRMSEAIGVQIVADNRAGAGGTIGVQTAANSAPDGYTLLMAAPSLTINATLMRPPPYDPLRDFTPVGQATTSQYVIVVHPSVPVHNVKELIALAKAQPGKLNYGSGGPGNSTHL
ncbi:MAG: Bug family tripartite tricarboxylate transporter substrate binding protein, partial [Burkholderiales bacterium]